MTDFSMCICINRTLLPLISTFKCQSAFCFGFVPNGNKN